MADSSEHPLSGLWTPSHLQAMHYGPASVKQHLLEHLPSNTSKAFIVTGSSLATKTSLISQVESLLGPDHHAGTFANITQHAPVAQLDEATEAVLKHPAIDTLISVGGGSPIDSAKVISHRHHERQSKYLHHIAIPTTLSAAECTGGAGYTDTTGHKVGVFSPALMPQVIIYDCTFAKETPQKLWLSTAIRSLDHAVESMYHPKAPDSPTKQLCLSAIAQLFAYLPKSKKEPANEEYITRLQLAAFNSLYSLGLNLGRGLGLSHSLGYALGSPYGIPHGTTSCLTLASVVRLKAEKPEDAEQLAKILPYIGRTRSGDNREDAVSVGNAIDELLKDVGLDTTLKEHSVGEDQVHKIANLATKTGEGELYDSVVALVKTHAAEPSKQDAGLYPQLRSGNASPLAKNIAILPPSESPNISWPLESPSPILDPSSDATNLNTSTHSNSMLTCSGTRYGRNLRLASCLQIWGIMSAYTVPRSFGERNTGDWDAPLPFRYLSLDGLCAIDLSHAAGTLGDTIAPVDLKEAARLIIQICIAVEPNEGGLVTGLGVNKALSLRIVPYRPTVTCGPDNTGPPELSCRDVIDKMPANNKRQVFGPRDQQGVTVPLPWAYTTGRRRCGAIVDAVEEGRITDEGDWYKIWAAANAVDFMCCQQGRRGVATALGDNKRLYVELRDLEPRGIGASNSSVTTE
ncbi:MAG: hypothetical protein LQ348_006577 [Seirophora lacunosa]|nr:MAG: hypothetical protein LQ348_006577 [Seirophora lacunosa]